MIFLIRYRKNKGNFLCILYKPQEIILTTYHIFDWTVDKQKALKKQLHKRSKCKRTMNSIP